MRTGKRNLLKLNLRKENLNLSLLIMFMRIKIKTDKFEFKAELNESKTAKAIYESLPVKAKGFRWGGEIYFSIPVHVEYENQRK